jgi:hypothetical protein
LEKKYTSAKTAALSVANPILQTKCPWHLDEDPVNAARGQSASLILPGAEWRNEDLQVFK